MPTKIILDTDIGSDIDDALALAYLLAQPECELLGITTVTGEAKQRAMMASALCKIANKQVPIYPGIELPLIVPTRQPSAPQVASLDKWAHDTTFPRGEAIEFLRQTIHAHPGEVILLGIGPLTNIALLFAIDPEVPALLKKLVLMCGVFEKQNVQAQPLLELEWNALNDPHAAAIVYRAAVSTSQSLGLDVTTQVTMNAQEFRSRCGITPLLQPVLDFANVWFQQNDTITFHDPLAATTIFNPAICAFTRGTVSIELANKELAGKTYWDTTTHNPQHQISLEVKPELFFEEYFSIF